MDKLPEYHVEEDIEGWLEVFACRAACSKVKDDKSKIQWCHSVVGSVWRRILKSLDDQVSWATAKEELRKYLSEENPREAACKKLRRYKGKGKSFGEIGSEVKDLAMKAAEEKRVQEKLAVWAFLGAIPWPLAKGIRSRQINSLQKALVKARLMQLLEEEEARRGRVMAVTAELRSERQIERCSSHREERRNRWPPVCWSYGREGHLLRNCELWKSFRERRHQGHLRLLEKGRAGNPELNLEKGPLGTYMAPGQVLACESIFQEFTVAGVDVKALID